MFQDDVDPRFAEDFYHRAGGNESDDPLEEWRDEGFWERLDEVAIEEEEVEEDEE